MISAIILAGGSSIRLGGETPKQFLEIDGKELIDFSISTFLSVKEIDEIILVIPQRYKQKVEEKYPNLNVVIGGSSRQKSSYNGILACSEYTEKVLIHDAARVFITSKLIKNCIETLDKYDAVTLAIPLVDTIALCENNNIKKIENRENLKAIQTPQGFDYKKIKLVHENFKNDATDDMKLMLESGYPCKIINGHEDNFKITTQADLFYAEYKIKGQK
ncbi:MAG: 2-C-methyl-D-erythritol 4-phosphate cytidylyltransferase [Candidatus Marinimicrobia bacterium]|nr:2-C-methyl-D-erythritol 4-phosphate cytidylyltransferase [Candidatus Neomarinimicrobiota bacterium]|tara:strand:+ start:861 stop:1514 length:654 start_codon:yes stop_codon:yes gene_type:complete